VVAAAYYPGHSPSHEIRMPATWKYMMIALVALLIASMVIAIVKLASL
jgi:hypothetical protein